MHRQKVSSLSFPTAEAGFRKPQEMSEGPIDLPRIRVTHRIRVSMKPMSFFVDFRQLNRPEKRKKDTNMADISLLAA